MGLASVIDNRSILEKATDLALSDLTTDGGLLESEQAQRFIRILIDESVVMKQATVVPMKSHKKLLEKARFASRVLRAGAEATALPVADRSKPDLSKVELDAQLFKAEVRLNDEVLEDNIERGNLKNTIMQMMAEAISRDMDEVIINGDTSSGDAFLAKFDGLLVQASSNVVVVGSTPLDKTVLRDMLKTMPSEFLRNKRALRYFTSVDARLDYVDSLSDRATDLGDRSTTMDPGTEIGYSAVPVIDVPLFPEDQGSLGETSVILTDPKNIHVGIWRNIKVETDRLVREGVLIIVATLRFDMKFTEETAVVKATKVKVT